MSEELKTLKDMEIKLFVEDFKRGKVSCDVVDSNGKVRYLGEYYEEDVPKGSNIIAKIKEANIISGRTLIDIFGDRLIDSKDLRSEAIKWIRISMATQHPLYKMWLEFFNLTEADLK
jgi:hypothetical protein